MPITLWSNNCAPDAPLRRSGCLGKRNAWMNSRGCLAGRAPQPAGMLRRCWPRALMRTVVQSSAKFGVRQKVRIGLGLLLLSLLQLSGQELVPQARLPLFHAAQLELSNASDGRDFSIQIPRHIQIEDASEVRLTLRPLGGQRLPPMATTLAWNGRMLTTNPPPEDPTAPLKFHVPVRVPTLRLGPNTLSLRFVLQDTNEASSPRRPVGWMLRREDCCLDLAHTRATADTALERLPHSLAEEQLLHQELDVSSNAV